jgi:CRP-like cAMP-binding protein
MEAVNPRSGRSDSEAVGAPNSRALVGRPGAVGEGYQKIKNRLISRGLPESVVNELFEQPTIVNYGRGSFIFLQGGPTDLFFWVSSGLVDILCPGPNGEQIIANVLGPGEFLGFLEFKDHKGRPAQAFQARVRTNAQIGLVIRTQVSRVLAKQDPALLIHILEETVAAWSKLTLHCVQFLGNNYADRLEIVLADLAAKFGVSESRGTLLIPEFGHGDFAEMIGCSRPMVSRLISEMIAAGSLAKSGKRYIIREHPAVNIRKQSS